MTLEECNVEGQQQAQEQSDPYINEEPINKLVLGGIAAGYGMVWDPKFIYRIKIKPSEWTEIIALDILTPDESNIPRNCSLILPSGISVDFVNCRQTDDDDEVTYVALPSKINGHPEVLIEPGKNATISVTSSEVMWRGRAVGGDSIGPIEVINEEDAPVHFDVKCIVPRYGDALCPVLNIYYKKSFPPKNHESAE